MAAIPYIIAGFLILLLGIILFMPAEKISQKAINIFFIILFGIIVFKDKLF